MTDENQVEDQDVELHDEENESWKELMIRRMLRHSL